MSSSLHEVLVEIFRMRPALAAELLTDALGVPVPRFAAARLEPADFVEVTPTEVRADAVVVLTDDSGPVGAVIVEVQLRPDVGKHRTWPMYVHNLGYRLRCPVLLLVVCVDDATAQWAATPIRHAQPGSSFTPLVLGPARVPLLTDPAVARGSPELAVLAALAHGRRPDRVEVLDVLAEALAGVETEQALLYLRLVLAALPQAARAHLEGLMATGTFDYQSEFTEKLRAEGRSEGRAEGRSEGRAEGRSEGRAEAKADGVLRVLRVRGVEVPDDVRQRITECSDLGQLDRWLERAITIDDARDLMV